MTEIAQKQPQRRIFNPFAYALFDNEMENYCWYCLKENSPANALRKCSACGRAVYCDKQCQSLGWFDHKPECKATCNLKGESIGFYQCLSLDVRMLVRIIWRYKNINKQTRETKNSDFWLNRTSERSIIEICDHVEDIRKDDYAVNKFETIYEMIVGVYDKKYLCDKETAFQLHCRNFINRHSINDASYLKEIAKGLYLDLCAYDHSCSPNTIYTCNGFVATLRPLTEDVDIDDKSKTYYTYINLLASKQLRRKLLSESWYFTCHCSRCDDQNDHLLTSLKCPKCDSAVCIFKVNTLIDSPKCSTCGYKIENALVDAALAKMRSIDKMLDDSDSLLRRHDNDHGEVLKYLQGLLVESSRILPKSNIYLVQILQALINFSDGLDTENLLKWHNDATECMQLCYPDNHPALAYHFMNIGIFNLKLNNITDAKLFLMKASKRLQYVLDADHSMTKQCLEWLQKCSTD